MTRHQTSPRRTVRWARGFAIVAAAALTLTGCMKIQTDLTLNPDNTGSMSMIMAISDEFASQTGMDPQEMWDSMSGDMASDAPEGADQQPYAEDGYTGVKYTLAEAPIDQLSTQDMTIERVGDNYVFTGTMDLTDETTDTTDTTDPMTQAMMDTFIVAVSVTFPGAVSEHNGELDGNTVTWSPKLGELAEMSATGSAIAGGGATTPTTEPSDEATATDEPADVTEPTDEATDDVTASDEGSASSGFPWWLLGVVAAVLVAAVVGIVLLANRGRKEPSPAAAFAGGPEGQPQWQGQPGQPPQWQGQPGQQQPPQWQGQPTQQMPPAPQTPPPPQWQQPQTPPPPQTPPAQGQPPAQDWQGPPTEQIPPQEPPADGQQPGQNPPA